MGFLGLRIEDELKDQLNEKAERENKSISQVVKELIETGVSTKGTEISADIGIVTCRNCQEEFDRTHKRCPECGVSNHAYAANNAVSVPEESKQALDGLLQDLMAYQAQLQTIEEAIESSGGDGWFGTTPKHLRTAKQAVLAEIDRVVEQLNKLIPADKQDEDDD